MKTPATYLESLDRIPPYLAWMMARNKDGTPITQRQISEYTGWPMKRVRRFCGIKSWKQFIEPVDLFRAACGINRLNEAKHLAYLKRTLNLTKVTTSLSAFRKRPMVAQNRVRRIIRESRQSKP